MENLVQDLDKSCINPTNIYISNSNNESYFNTEESIVYENMVQNKFFMIGETKYEIEDTNLGMFNVPNVA